MRKHELAAENKRLREERNDLSKQSVEQESDLMRLGLIPDEYIIALAFGSRYVNWSKIREDREALEAYEAAERGRKLAGNGDEVLQVSVDAERIIQTAADIDRFINSARRTKPRNPWMEAKPGEIWALDVDDQPERTAMTVVVTDYGIRFRNSDEHGTIYALDTPAITAGHRIWPEEAGDGK